MNTRAQPIAPSGPPLGRRAHRALGSPSRVLLLEAIRADGPLDAEQLVSRVGLHLNTVRAHLNVLRDAGLIDVRSLPVVGAGRPRLAFTATDLVADEVHPGAYRLLARILTSSLQGREDGRNEATVAGIPAGRRLVDESKVPGTAERVIAMRALLDHLGFAPEPADVAADGSHAIELKQCPFRDLVAGSRSVVCAAHHGLLQGAYAGLGGDPKLVSLIPFAAPGICSVRLRVASKTATSPPRGG